MAAAGRVNVGNFNPRSPWGERLNHGSCDGFIADFNPRSPWGERLINSVSSPKYSLFQSTLPVGGATCRYRPRRTFHCISIHAPRGGSDPLNPSDVHIGVLFQSTLPVGGATISMSVTNPIVTISIHAPRGGSDSCGRRVHCKASYFNPRSPWGERHVSLDAAISGVSFQSTLPVGGATRRRGRLFCCHRISIHAPRGGSDCYRWICHGYANHFNPRSPWGERLKAFREEMLHEAFQSTLPVGGATGGGGFKEGCVLFQSTLPVGGATLGG